MASKVEEAGNRSLHNDEHDVVNLISSLPREVHWAPLSLYGGFWIADRWLRGTIAAQQHMASRDDDILVAAPPKSGMTWLKSLVFAVFRRGTHPPADPMHPLRRANPHECILFQELFFTENREADLEALPSPRLMSTHTPYSILPASVAESDCRIVYICRNPKDVYVSYWHFMGMLHKDNKERLQPMTLERGVELFCSGVYPFGPYCENVLEFWHESLKRPDKVFFVKYEDMKEDPAGNLRRLAAFLGKPFSEEEEHDGTMGQILELCRFRSLKEMEVNREGNLTTVKTVDVPRNSLFRRGEVGDWVNYFTPEMAAKMDAMIQEKLQGSGLKL